MKWNRKAGALCAVMFLLCQLLPLLPTAAAVGTMGPDDVYAVDIEFGSLSFYYDYGVWNVRTMRREASATSSDPAVGTPDGMPGWYGFDGIANRVAVVNYSEDKDVTVAFTYRRLRDDELSEAKAPAVVTGVSMSLSGAGWTDNSATVPAGNGGASTVEGFIQLTGEPRVNSGRYESDQMLPIGMFTMTITAWEP